MQRQQGFSLIELILVMLILSLLATSVSRLVAKQTLAYIERSRQQDLLAASRIGLERMVRELREALPNSIRVIGVAGASQCIEFLPIVAGSYYVDSVVGFSVSSLKLVDFNYNNDGKYLVVYPYNTADLYAVGSTSLATISSVDATVDAGANNRTRRVNLVAAQSFLADSPRRRAYLVSEPVSFCINTLGQLSRHQSYGRLSSQVLLPGSSQLLAENIRLTSSSGSPVSVFQYLPASLQRNALVTLELPLLWVDMAFALKHSLQLRNLP